MNLANMARRLLVEMAADSLGDFLPSLYETARVAALAPALAGHDGRIRHLLAEQRPGGSWSGPGDYAVLPTLSATDALFAELARTGDPEVGHAVHRGLTALWRMLSGPVSLPDTVAVELLVPWLVAELNVRLAALDASPLPGLDAWRGRRTLPCPSGTYPEVLLHLREAVEQGAVLPEKLWHSLEMFGTAAEGLPYVQAGRFGVGCSPAATAAWFGSGASTANPHPAVRYLELVQARHGGPVPVAAPLDVFERAWVLATFTDVGLPVTVPPELVDTLRGALGETGAPGGAGLPTDADDTSTALHALANLGVPSSLDCLWHYRNGDHFSTFADERTPSVTTNAHVLQAFAAQPQPDPRVADAMLGLAAWLRERQHPDGSWTDKWHASPYYATLTCVVALDGFGESREAIGKAVQWVVENQHPNGSWGFWDGTAEETAYAVQILLRAKLNRLDPVMVRAAARGCEYLLGVTGAPCPPLWHDKDLYTPARIIRAETIAALHVALGNPRVAARLSRVRAHDAERTAG